jgi:hypothetical protein
MRRQWETTDRIKRDLEDPLQGAMDGLFIRQEAEAIRRLRTMRRTVEPVLTLDTLFSVAEWLLETEVLMRPYLLDAILSGWRTGRARLDLVAFDITSSDPAVIEALEALNIKGKGITRTSAERIAQIVQEALEKGLGVDEVERRLRDEFDSWRAGRSHTIAVTSVTTGFEAGQYAAFRRAGIRATRWLSERDKRVRPTHDVADGQEQPLNSPFTVGRALLLHPGDPTGPANEVIGCRCTLLPLT